MNYLFNGIWEDPDNNRYVTQDGQAHINFEDAQAHMNENYWSQEELPLQNVIDDLREKKVENFGVLPEYIASPLNTESFDLFDSSTWMVPDDPFYQTYIEAEGAKMPMSSRDMVGLIRPIDEKKVLAEIDQIQDPDERAARIDKFDQQILDQDVAQEKYGKNMIDVLAKDNPEIRTGFFPRTYYPEIATSNLSDYLTKGFRVRKTGIDEDAGGHYDTRFDEIALKPTEEGLLPDWQKVLEIMGHEGGYHYSYPHQYEENDRIYKRRGLNALQHTMPWPENSDMNRWAGKWSVPPAAGHSAGIALDQMFFPTGMRGFESDSGTIWREHHPLNLKGVENLRAIMNWTPNTMPREINEKPVKSRIANIPASNIDYTAPDRGDWGPGLHLSTGGIASLML